MKITILTVGKIKEKYSAIRITHLPSGIVVECQDERSQHKNRARAMALLQAKLLSKAQEEQQQQQASERRSLVGSGDRSERIRTYNFPQGRITDHRINLTLYKLAEIMDGALEHVPQKLLASLESLIAGLRDDGGQLTKHLAAVGADLGVACRQSLGILTGQESSLVETGDGPTGELQSVRVSLTRVGGSESVALVLRMTAADVTALAAPDGADEGAADKLLHAVATPAAARVAHALSQRGWTFSANASTENAEPDTDAAARVLVRTEGGQLLEAVLSVDASPPPAVAAG